MKFLNRFNPFIKLMKIGTHDGRFHCDEVLACTMLTKYTQKFFNAEIVRSRDPNIWNTCDILVDVGGKYEPPFLLDHHQIQFQGNYPNHNVRLSSAGLVYMHYPQIIPNIITKILQDDKSILSFDPIVSEEIITEIRQRIYKNFIIYVDAGDNGIDKVHDKQFTFVPSTLWSRIGKLNPMWWDEKSNEMELFRRGMQMTNEELYSEVRCYLLGSIQTKSLIEKAFHQRKEVHPSGKIILLEKYVPWPKSLSQIQVQTKCQGQILYVVFPQKTGLKWRIQAVPTKQGAFELRRGLKTEWRGIKDMEKLVEISGIKDIDFVHANGFIGGAISKQSAILMGQLSF